MIARLTDRKDFQKYVKIHWPPPPYIEVPVFRRISLSTVTPDDTRVADEAAFKVRFKRISEDFNNGICYYEED